jgi:photosystem II stability/assembly factor-like uncharacterized protein
MTIVGLVLLGLGVGIPPTLADTGIRPLDQPAIAVKNIGRIVYTGVTRAGSRLVAVGEHGVIVLSDDGGRSWRQAPVPVNVTLTDVSFATNERGWATGHFGVILTTADGGETWTRQMDGLTASAVVLDAAKTAAAAAPEGDRAAAARLRRATRWADAGPSIPFLALFVADERTVVAFGAYGLVLRSSDGGTTWEDGGDKVDNIEGLHPYAVAAKGREVYVVGEAGLVLHSGDGGATFARIDGPEEVTFFGAAIDADGALVVAGLKGRVARRGHDGAWSAIETGTDASLTAIRPLRDDDLVIVGAAGKMFLADTRLGRTSALDGEGGANLSGVAIAPSGDIVTVGDRGLATMPLKQQ